MLAPATARRPSWSSPPRPARSPTRPAPGSASAATARRRRPTTLEMAEAAGRVPLPGRPLGPRHLRPGRLPRASPKPPTRDAGRRPRPDLLRAGRQLRHREPPPSRPTQAEDRVERQAREFELLKPYLVERWDAVGASWPPDRPGRRQRAGRRADDERRCRCPAILIPVANPMTAEELIRLGAALLDPRAGELVRARHRRGARGHAAVRGRDPRPARPAPAPARPRLRARRDDDPPDRADRPPRRRGHRRGVGRAGGRPHHLRLGRQGRRPAATAAGRPSFSPTIDEVVRDVARATSRSSSSAARKEIRRILVPVRGGPHAELALRYADAHRAAITTRRSSSSTSSRPGSRWRSAPRPSARSPRSSSSTSTAAARRVLREAPNVRNAILREAEKADLVVMGASAQPGGADGETLPVRGAARGDRRRAPSRRSSSSRPASRSAARRSSSWRRGPRRSPPPTAPPRRRAPSRSGSSAGSASRTSTTPSSPTCAASSRSRRSRA